MQRYLALFLVACFVLSSAPALAQSITQIVSGSLTDGRPQVWAVDSQGDLWTMCKQTTDPNSDWTPWSSFQTPAHLSVSPLSPASAFHFTNLVLSTPNKQVVVTKNESHRNESRNEEIKKPIF